MKTNALVDKIRNEGLRIACFLRTGYYSRGERVNPDVPDANFQNHLRVYRFMQQFAADQDVIDIGSGTGYGTALLAAVAKSVVGIDISESAVRWAKKRYPGVNYIRMNAQRLEFPDRSFGLIVSTENFEHLVDQRAHVGELARVLRPDGLCFVATPNPELSVGTRNPYHTKENSFDELKALFTNDFRSVTILENTQEPDTAEGQALRAKRRLEERVGVTALEGADSTWLSNTHSFFCFCRGPIASLAKSVGADR